MSTRFEEISHNLSHVESKIVSAVKKSGRNRSEVTLIAVTKNFPISDVEILKELGITNFGENRDQEGASKSAAVQGKWHFQGQIQSNKLKSISSWAGVIHSLDDPRYVEILDRVAINPLSAFIQVSLDDDPERGGIAPKYISELARAVRGSTKVELLGLMAVPPLTQELSDSYANLARIRQEFLYEFPEAHYLSAGMSSDYEMAIEYGATHIRVGSEILGSRH
ncbi:unannotated protein [freshwater metagenome]|uniref:Unannotated protein n=1 Tax=freshwater metagenome TaxID=449393 RepID=A0A6J7XWJ9_9ZZZZ|nr:YggS family pyridoxal phosphate-dependent enzyme [Actinomycetota bacterium]